MVNAVSSNDEHAHTNDQRESGLKLGVDSFSLRWQGWNAHQLVDYSARLGLDVVHLSERRNLASLDESYLVSLKDHAAKQGLSLEIGMGSFDRFSASFRPELGSGAEQLTAMLNAAKIVGSPSVRCFLGNEKDRSGPIPHQLHMEECVRTLRQVAPVARNLGVKIAVENHGPGVDLLAREVQWVIEEAGTDYVGSCLDTGNPAYAGEDPVLTVEVLAPYAVTSHIRDTRVWSVPDGAMAQWAPLGQGSVDLKRIVAIWREKMPDVAFDLETITGSEPRHLPFLDPNSDFWSLYPNVLARDFSRYLALAQSGTPGPIEQVVAPWTSGEPPDDLMEALRAQQLRHFEESVAYARDVLGVGER
jgi:3-oxoisoapionate decarboxylase